MKEEEEEEEEEKMVPRSHHQHTIYNSVYRNTHTHSHMDLTEQNAQSCMMRTGEEN